MPIVASTHISASDNFQLGDSASDKHVLHGHLSGSIETTGSFGMLNIASSANISGPIYVIDNKQIYLGTDDDFSIYHNGSHAYLNNTTGNVYYRNDVGGASHIFMTQYGGGSLTSVFEVTDGGAILNQGNLTVANDIIIDDGGSLKEAGGTAAFTFDASGHVTKIGQDSPSTGQFLKWDGSKAVWDAASSGGGAISALNNATVNELVTVGATTTELDAEANLVFDGTKLGINTTSPTSPLHVNKGNIDAASVSSFINLSGFTYSKNFNVQGEGNLQNFRDIYFSPDGKRMFGLSLSFEVNSYYLSGSWDIGSAVMYNSVKPFGNNAGSPYEYPSGITFSSDGKNMYSVGAQYDTIIWIKLSQSWIFDKGTRGSGTEYTAAGTFSVATQESDATGIDISPDGTNIYIVGTSGDDVNQYKLSTPYDITTAAYLQNFSISSQEAQVEGIRFKPSGDQFYIVGSSGDEVNVYNLTTNWDISTATAHHTIDVSGQDTDPNGLYVSHDGKNLYIAGDAGNTVDQWVTNLSGSLAPETYHAGVNRFYGTFQSVGDSSFDGKIDIKPNSEVLILSSSLKLDGGGAKLSSIYSNNISDMSASFVRDLAVGASTPSNLQNNMGIFFSPDGRRMYLTDLSNEPEQWSLSTPWDISTGTRQGEVSNLAGASYSSYVAFSDDGLTMFAFSTHNSSKIVEQLSLTRPWDILHTAPSNVKQYTLEGLPGSGADGGFWFGKGGTRMFVVDNTTGKNVVQYNMSGSWDIGTISGVSGRTLLFTSDGGSHGPADANPADIAFNGAGTVMYILGRSNMVSLYELGNAWEISSAQYIKDLPILAKDTECRGLYVSPDQKNLYIAGASLASGPGKEFQYALTYDEISTAGTIRHDGDLHVSSDLTVAGHIESEFVSGSQYSTASFGVLMSGGSVVGADDTSWNDGTATRISGSSTSTGSFGAGYIDNKLGIGTASPEGALHITAGNSGNATVKGISIGMSGDYASIELKGTSTSAGGGFIDFGYPSHDFQGRIIYNNSDDSMLLYTGTALALTINSSQNATFAGTIGSGAITSTGLITGTDLSISGTSTTIGTVTSGIWNGTAIAISDTTGTLAVARGGTALTSLSTLLNSNVTSVSGNAGTATSVATTQNNSEDATHYLTFVDGYSGNQGIEVDTALHFNPSTNTLTATNITGTASTATNATNVVTTQNNSEDATHYLTFLDGYSGNQGIEVDTALHFNPSTDTLTAPNITGNASTSTKISSITNSNIVQLADSQTLTNKTLTSPVINVTSDAEGDIYYRSSAATFTRLARGANDYVLTMNGNVPNWEAASGGGGGGGGNLTTKGDIEAYTTSQTRLAVGTNDYVLTADSSTAAGIAWKVAGGSGVTVSNNSNNRVVTGDGSNANAEANLTFDGSTLTVTGDATVTGDITIDDGGSLKEAGGTTAFTFDASGHVTKIGQDSPGTDEVLSWDGSKAVWATAGGGGSSIWTTTGDYKSTTSALRISGSAPEGSLVISGSASHPRLKVHGVSGNVLNIGNNVGGINTPPASGHSTGSMFAITTNFGITHFEAFVDGTFAIGQDPFDHSYTIEHVPYGKPLLKRTGQMFLSGSSPSGSSDYSGSAPTLEVHGSGSISYYQGLSGRLLSIDDDENDYKPVSSSAPVSASAVFSVNSYFGSPLFEIFPDGTSNLFSNVWEQPILRRNHMMHLSGSSLPLAPYSSEDYTLHVEGSGSIFKVQNEQSVKFNVESDAKSFSHRTGSILTVSDDIGVPYFNVFNDATFTLGTIANPIIKRNNSWHISSSNHNEETYSSNDYTVQIEGSGSNIFAVGDSVNTRFAVDEHDVLDTQKTILNISDQAGHPIISVRDTREGFRQATIITGSGGPFPTFTEHDRLLLAPQHWDSKSAGLGSSPVWSDTFTSEASEPIARSGDIIMLGTTSVTRGMLYHLAASTAWVAAGADVSLSEANLLAIALDTGVANVGGMLLKGVVSIPDALINGTPVTGAPVYVSTTTAGEYDFTATSTSADRVRVVGYCLAVSTDSHVFLYFDPDKTGITLS